MTDTIQVAQAVEATTTTPAATTSWRDSLPEEIKVSKSLEKFENIADLSKSYIHLEKTLGEKRPSAPEKYVLPDEASSIFDDKILATAKELNMTQDQIKNLADKLIENKRVKDIEQTKLAEQHITAEKAKLEAKFGGALDDRLKQMDNVLVKFGGTELAERIKASPISRNADFVELVDKLTQEVLQVKMISADFEKAKSLTPAEAQQEIIKLRSDPSFQAQYTSKNNEIRQAAVQKLTDLYRI